MRSKEEVTRLIREANKCLVNDDPPNPPRMDFEKFYELLTDEERNDFADLFALGMPQLSVGLIQELENAPAEDSAMAKVVQQRLAEAIELPTDQGIINYRGKFFRIHKRKTSEGDLVLVLSDEKNNVHTVIGNGKVLWTKEL